MTSWGQVTTQPAHPVHSPVVTTSSYSSFHCAVQRPAGAPGVGGGLSGAVTLMAATYSCDARGTFPGRLGDPGNAPTPLGGRGGPHRSQRLRQSLEGVRAPRSVDVAPSFHEADPREVPFRPDQPTV